MQYTLATSIRYTRELLNSVNHMTYFLDYNWTRQSKTLPIVFFYLMDWSSNRQANMNTKPLIIYDGSQELNSNNFKQSYIQVVSDNIVLQPEEYELKVIIPYTLQQMNYFRNIELSASLNINTVYNVMQNPIFKTLVKIMGETLFKNDNTSFTNVMKNIGLSFTNENTEQIDALKGMFNNRLPIQMKLPTGWKFVNAIITSLQLNKEHDENGFMNGNIKLMVNPPILQIRENSHIDNSQLIQTNEIYSNFGNTLHSMFMGIGGQNQ